VAYIQKRVTVSGAPAYVVKWRTPDGKQRTKGGFRTRKAASAYATEVAHAQQRGNTFDPKAGQLTFRAAAQLWLLSRHDLKPTTLAGYRYALAPAQTCRLPRKTLGIDVVFGGYPLNSITRQQISAWIATLAQNGYAPATIRAYMQVVRMVLAQAVIDNIIASNPAAHVKLPGSTGKSTTAVVDDPSQFLTAAQVQALTVATPWPYNVLVHLAAWAGLRAGELAGLQVGDVNPNGPNTTGMLRVVRSVVLLNKQLVYQAPKTKGSRRTVPLTADTAQPLAAYLAVHPHAKNPLAPLFPGLRLTGNAAHYTLELDWANPLQHKVFYRLVFKPAVRRVKPALPLGLTFHSLRHTYVSLCVAAGIPPLEISRFAGPSTVTTTLSVYAHLFGSDHSAAMAALGAMAAAPANDNVVPLRGRAQ
jgi:integrase